ncbi:hypothetical protein SLE2022_231510 [Rubroshorea leprosula]
MQEAVHQVTELVLHNVLPFPKMKVKKQKCHRKTVGFFSVCFGFRQPFNRVMGTFGHRLLFNNITPTDTVLFNCLCVTVKLFTNGCLLAELKTLDASYCPSFQAANKLTIARCDREKRMGADEGVKSIFTVPKVFFQLLGVLFGASVCVGACCSFSIFYKTSPFP